jgi:uroporphyrinogen III methyltransferase/synthase
MKSKGQVYLVGAGPGDPGLLTLRGAELLRRAEVVVYDMLVNPALLLLAPPSAECISRGRRGQAASLTQDQLNELIIQRAREGKCVVRLKGGDPYIFGRGAEEAEALAAAKIPFEVVPGVSSVIAAPNCAGIPLTHRRHCSSFTVMTGHEDPASPGFEQEIAALARVPGTKVVLMGLKRIRDWSQALMRHGVAPATPAALIEWGTTGRQKSVAGTLEQIADLAERHRISPPALTVIGDVVQLRSTLNWFEHRPLFGQRIVVTRAREQAGPLARRLTELGADVLEIPTIRVVPPDRKQEIVDALLDLNAYDWLVFTSVNGVDAFFDIFFKRFQDLRDIGGVRIAAVGPATAAKLREYHLQVDLVPEEALASKIATAFRAYESIENLKICLLRAEVANSDLPEALEELGAIVDDVAVYKTVAETQHASGEAERLRDQGADWIVFTSPSTVRHFHARFDLQKLVQQFPRLQMASIGPETSAALQACQLAPAVEANPHTTEGLVAALLKKHGPGR